MKQNKSVLILALFAFLLAACQPASPSELPNGPVVLGVGQSIASADGRASVTFVQLVEDNRCPADAICLTSGSVRVLVEVSLGTEIFQATLTSGDMLEGDVNWITVGGATVTLS
ncbi:MAG TPA: hypothetical protein VF982_04150, partial [Anaerolineales bacterium]